MSVPLRTAVVTPSASLATRLPDSPAAALVYDHFAGAVGRAVNRVARRYRLAHVEAEDIRSDLWVKLLSNGGEILDRVERSANPEGYLTTIARNILLDGEIARRGKWRPSTAARREGPAAVLAERLLCREGLPVREAHEWMRCARPVLAAAAPASAMLRIHIRRGRRFVGESLLETMETRDPSPFDVRCASEASREILRLKAALVEALERLCSDDRRLLHERYVTGRTVAAIASSRSIAAKPLYRHFARLLRQLRTALVVAGVDPREAVGLLAQDHLDWHAGPLQAWSGCGHRG